MTVKWAKAPPFADVGFGIQRLAAPSVLRDHDFGLARVQIRDDRVGVKGLERVAFNQVHLIERDSQHYQRLACLGLHSI